MINKIIARINDQPEIYLRPIQQSDQIFLEELFRSTRDFLLQLALPAQHIDTLIKQQYQMQQVAYQQQFPQATTWIIASNHSIGKITLAEINEELHIVDIIFASDMRGKGHGSSLLKMLQLSAQEHCLALTLVVDQHNIRAKNLYASLGFIIEKTSDTHDFLCWRSLSK